MVPFRVKKGFFRLFLGVFRLPDKQDVPGNQEATNQRPSLAQAWPLYIHTIERWEGGHFWSKRGVFGSQTSRTSRGRAQNKRAAPQSCLRDRTPVQHMVWRK